MRTLVDGRVHSQVALSHTAGDRSDSHELQVTEHATDCMTNGASAVRVSKYQRTSRAIHDFEHWASRGSSQDI